jgi:hypothetical protein
LFLYKVNNINIKGGGNMLIGHWPLNGNTNDVSRYGNNGVPTNITYAAGKIGQAANFNGSSSQVNASNNSIFNLGQQFSITFWVNPELQTTSFNGIVSKTGGNTTGYEVRTTTSNESTTNIQFRVLNGSDIGLTININNNVWTHIVAKFNSGKYSIYKNGLLEAQLDTVVVSPAVVSQELRIGRLGYASLFFKGFINDVRIYDHALTDMEIQELARAKILHYTFDDFQEPTTNVVDMTVVRYNGTPTGSDNLTLISNSEFSINTAYWNDGGAYVDVLVPVLTTTQYTMSFEYYIDPASTASLRFDPNGTWNTGFTLSTVGQWTFVEWTFTTSTTTIIDCNFYSSTPGLRVIANIRNMQCEQKAYSTPFVIGSRTAKVNDYSGFFNHSDQLTEANTPRWLSNAKIGNGNYIFPGSSTKFINIPTSIIGTSEGTISAWIKTSISQTGAIFVWGDGGTTNWGIFNIGNTTGAISDEYIAYVNLGANSVSFFGRDTVTSNSNLLADGEWHHIVARISDSEKAFFVDGVKLTTYHFNQGSQSTTGSFMKTGNNTIIKVGDSTYNGGHVPFNGNIDDVRIYSTVLSDKDILDLYNTKAEIEQSGVLYARDFLSNAEATVNLISTNFSTYNFDASGFATIGTRTVQSDGSVLIVNNNSNSRLARFNIPILVNIDYTISVKIRKVSGTGPLPFRWQLQGRNSSLSVITTFWTELVAVHEDNLGWQTLSYTFKFTNSTITNLYVFFQSGADFTGYTHSYYLNEPQLELKPYATPFVSTFRPAIELPTGVQFGANEIHETGIANFEDFSTVGITDGLIGYWPLNGLPKDLSGLNRNGTEQNGVLAQSDSYYFDGVNDMINFGTGNTFFPLYAHTISIMFRSDGVTATTGTSPALFGFTYGIRGTLGSNGNPTFALYKTTGNEYINAGGTYNYHDGKWHMFTATCDGTTIKLYIDGEYKSSGIVSDFWDGYTSWPTNSWNLGRDNNNSMYYFRGNMKEHKLFNRALTAEEIKIEYNTMFNNQVQIHESGVVYAKDLTQY